MKTAILTILLVAVAALGGCSVAKKWVTSDEGPLRDLVIDQVHGAIDGDPEAREAYIAGVEKLRSYVHAETEVRAGRLGDYARDLLERHRDDMPSKRYAAGQLIIAAVEEAISRHGRDDLDKLSVLRVLDWVEQAAYSADVSARSDE